MLEEILTVIIPLIYRRRKHSPKSQNWDQTFDLPIPRPMFFPLHYASYIFLIYQTSSPKRTVAQTNNLLGPGGEREVMKFFTKFCHESVKLPYTTVEDVFVYTHFSESQFISLVLHRANCY
jgi:hypothetical protein